MKLAQPVILALLLALLLAYVMDPLMMFLKRMGLPLWLAILITALVFLGILFSAGTIIISNLISFARNLPRYQEQILIMLRSIIENVQNITQSRLNFDILEEIGRLPIGSMILNTARDIFSNITQFLMIFLFAILILLEKYYLPRKLVKVFSRHKTSKIPSVLKHIDISLRRYIGAKTLISLMVGTCFSLILLLFRVEFAVVWGFMTFLLNFIPSIGSIIATLLPFIFALIQFAGTPLPFWILLCLFIVQNITGSILDPLLMGDRLNLSLLIVFLSLLFWGWLWGIAGILLAVPMTTTAKILIKNVPSLSRFAVLLEKLPRKKKTPWKAR